MTGIKGPGSGGASGPTPPPSSAHNASKTGSHSVHPQGGAQPAPGLPSLDKTANFTPEISPEQLKHALQQQGQSVRGALGLNFSSPTIAKSVQEFQAQFPPGSPRYNAIEKMSTSIAAKMDPGFHQLDPMEQALRVSDINVRIMQEVFSGHQ